MPLSTQQLQLLHSSCCWQDLWKASQHILEEHFTHHFVAGAFRFLQQRPMIIVRGAGAPTQSRDWWRRNAETHPLLDLIVERPTLKMLRITDELSVEEIKKNPYYQEFVQPEGWLYSVGLFFREGTEVLGLLAINRREDQGDLTDQEMADLHQLHGHFEAAFQRIAQLQRQSLQSHWSFQMLEKLSVAALSVHWDGTLHFSGPMAQQICLQWQSASTQTPRALKPSAAQLPEALEDALQELRRAVIERELFLGKNLPPPLEVSSPHNPKLRATIQCLHLEESGFGHAHFLVLFEQTEAPTLPPRILEPLTDSEREVARLVASGLSNKEIAHQLGKSFYTVKTQVQTILGKLQLTQGRIGLIQLAQSPSSEA